MKTDQGSSTVAERRQQAFELHLTGYTYAAIGTKLDISRQAAHGLVRRELDRLNRQSDNDASVMRALELERLDAMIRAIWDKAEKGSLGAIDRLLKISERRSKLLGLDSPTRASIDFPGQVPVHIYIPDNGRD